MPDLLTADEAARICLDDARARSGADAELQTITATEFPNSALGAPRAGEMSAQMMTSGWTLRVAADGRTLEYRANTRHIRLVGGEEGNLVVYPV